MQPYCNFKYLSVLLLCCVSSFTALVEAHHGVAGLGSTGLEGPGATIEAATSVTLPQDKTLFYLKQDQVKFKRFTSILDNEADTAQFRMAGIGHGITPWFSAYVFLPYNVKQEEGPNAFNTRGFADATLFGQIGFKYDKGLTLVPANESLDDLEDWHYTVFAGSSFPTANPNVRAADGSIDPGKSTGFGKSSYTAGITATKVLAKNWTFNVEMSGLWFQEYQYADGNRTKFGNEQRLNTGIVYRAYVDRTRKLRLDWVLEAQYLSIGRDRTNGVDDQATGGTIVYLLPGVRVYKGQYSFALGIKKPVSIHLNEENQQQGSEGKEDYRLVFTASLLF